MDTYSIVLVVVTALSLAATYSLGRTSKAARAAQREFEGAANT